MTEGGSEGIEGVYMCVYVCIIIHLADHPSQKTFVQLLTYFRQFSPKVMLAVGSAPVQGKICHLNAQVKKDRLNALV